MVPFLPLCHKCKRPVAGVASSWDDDVQSWLVVYTCHGETAKMRYTPEQIEHIAHWPAGVLFLPAPQGMEPIELGEDASTLKP